MMKLLDEVEDRRRLLASVNESCMRANTTMTAFEFSLSSSYKDDLRHMNSSRHFFAFVTPFIIGLGLIGNLLSIRVFTTMRMRKVSASFYLTALAISDTLVLLTYVLLDWLTKGLPSWPGGHSINVIGVQGVCQAYLYCSYSFRFLSAWLIVVFTLERYFGVCHPLHRRVLCTNTFAKRVITATVVVSFLVSMYKPIIAEAQSSGGASFCARNLQYEELNLALDAIYGCLITAVPFCILSVLNFLIVRELQRTRRRHRRARFSVDESAIKLEFTVILLIISTTFVVLNLPYFILWCYRFSHSSMNPDNPTSTERTRGWLYITKTVFFGNYSVNFFLYSLTGAYFRRQLRGLLCCHVGCSRPRTNSTSGTCRGTSAPLGTAL